MLFLFYLLMGNWVAFLSTYWDNRGKRGENWLFSPFNFMFYLYLDNENFFLVEKMEEGFIWFVATQIKERKRKIILIPFLVDKKKWRFYAWLLKSGVMLNSGTIENTFIFKSISTIIKGWNEYKKLFILLIPEVF